jgi:hypothetical protein
MNRFCDVTATRRDLYGFLSARRGVEGQVGNLLPDCSRRKAGRFSVPRPEIGNRPHLSLQAGDLVARNETPAFGSVMELKRKNGA